MLRIIIGVIVGFFVWSIVWVGTDSIFAALSPDAFGKNLKDFQEATEKNLPYTTPLWVQFFLLALSSFCSIVSGFVATWIAKERNISTIFLGILLLATGIFVEISFWNYFPLWYHLAFLALLIPMTILGGRLKRLEQVHNF